MSLKEGMLRLFRPLNPDFVRERVMEQSLQNSFVDKVKGISLAIPNLPEAESKNMFGMELQLGPINSEQIDQRLLKILEADGFGHPLPGGKVGIVVGFRQETRSAWLSLAFRREESLGTLGTESRLIFSVSPPSFSASFKGSGKRVLSNDALASLEGEKPNKRTVLEIANLAADFVSQALDNKFGATISTAPHLTWSSHDDYFPS